MLKETQKKTKQRLALYQSLNSFPHRKTKRQSCLFDMQHALCCVALVSACRLGNGSGKRKNKFSSIHTQTVVHFHWGEFTCVEFTTNSPKPSQTSHKFQKHSSSPRRSCKTTCSFQKKMQTQFGRKIGFSLLLKNESNQLSKTSCTSRKNEVAP